MNKYEIALVVSSRIDDEARTATLDKVKELVAKAGGTVTDIDDQGKKRLAYEIQDMIEAYYYYVHFEGPVEAPQAIESTLRITEPVIRFLIVRQDA